MLDAIPVTAIKNEHSGKKKSSLSEMQLASLRIQIWMQDNRRGL